MTNDRDKTVEATDADKTWIAENLEKFTAE